MSDSTRILIVDDHPVLAMGVQRLLDARDDLEVVAVLGTASELTQFRGRWDVLVLDVNLDDGSGLDLLDRMVARYPSGRVVIYSVAPVEQLGVTAIARGASAYISKNAHPFELRSAVEAAARNKRYISEQLADLLAEAQTSRSALTDRQVEIVQLLSMGSRPSEIADMLHLTRGTVSGHLASARKKLGAGSNVELVRLFTDSSSK